MKEYNNKNLKTEWINKSHKKRITKDEMKHNERMNEKI